MFYDLKHLLPEALGRAHIKPQIEASMVVEFANEIIKDILPQERSDDAFANNFIKEILNVNCVNSSVQQYVIDNEDVIISHLQKKLPKIRVKKIRTRIGRKEVEGYDF